MTRGWLIKKKRWNSQWNIILILLCRSGWKIYSSYVTAADFRFHPRRVHVSIIINIIRQLYVYWRRETRMLNWLRFSMYLYNIIIRYVIMTYIYYYGVTGRRVKWKKNDIDCMAEIDEGV